MLLRRVTIFGTLAAASLALAAQASGGETHADGSSTTQAEACKVALTLARQGIRKDQLISSHCECLENKNEREAPWSCSAFVSYR
jgi:hypothetical protein